MFVCVCVYVFLCVLKIPVEFQDFTAHPSPPHPPHTPPCFPKKRQTVQSMLRPGLRTEAGEEKGGGGCLGIWGAWWVGVQGREMGASAWDLASGIEHGVFGGTEAQEVPHLVAKLGQVLAQVVEVLHGGLVGALHLLARGGQVAVHQAAHDLLVVLIPLLLQVPPLLQNTTQPPAGRLNGTHSMKANSP